MISVAKDFSEFPGPRLVRQGPHSGEKFRRLLVKHLHQYDRVTVDLDGTKNGYGSSFLDEAFGGLVRSEGMSPGEVLRRVVIVSLEDPSYRDEALQAIRDARPIR